MLCTNSFKRVLIANRGEIAVRIAAAVQEAGLTAIAVYSDADEDALHVEVADVSVHIGPADVGASYLNVPALLGAAEAVGADAVHPGYGFLSENAEFARAVMDAGLVWIGPPPDAIAAMGDKARAKQLMTDAGVPVLPGWQGDASGVDLGAEADAVGYPLLIKAVAGGGGRGMRVVERSEDFAAALQSAQSEAGAAFGNGDVLLERYVVGGRHVEIQVLADGHGNVVHLGERECSLQRRHQKIVEEAPSPAVDADLRARMGSAAVAAAQTVGYAGAGTVEFLLEDDGSFWFLEMNTRLQVEHPVTEEVYGVDLVAAQLHVAAGGALELDQEDLEPVGHAIEARIYAEDPAGGFLPQSGRIVAWDGPELPGVRVDAGVRSGDVVSPHYDPMVAKVIAVGADREEARRLLVSWLRDAPVLGLQTNQEFLGRLLEHHDVATGAFDTTWVERNADALTAPAEAHPDLLALAALLLSLPDPVAAEPWSSRGEATWFVDLQHAGEAVSARVTFSDGSYSVASSAGVTDLAVLAWDGDALMVHLAGARRPALYARDGAALHLVVPSLGSVRVTAVDPLDRAAAARVGDGRIKSPIAGRVVRVLVEPGVDVEHGTPLVVVEAMKMEHHLAADVDGTVAEVRVAAGDQVAAGTIVAVVTVAD